MRKHTTRTLNSWMDTDSAAHAPTHACIQRADPTQNAKTNICTFAFRMDRGRARANARVTLTYTGTSIAKTEIHAYIQPTSLQKYI